MAFEGTPILEDFVTGVAENPWSDGGKWGPDAGRPRLQGNGGGYVYGSVEFAVNGMVYMVQAFTGDVIEVFGCTPGSGLGDALESQRVALWTSPYALTGYSIGHGGGISETYFFRKYTASAFIGIGDAHSRDDHPDRIGLRITPATVEAWGMYGTTWQLISTSTDTAYRGTFYAALETEEQGGVVEVGFSCFGGRVVNRTQIYRILRG